MTDILSLARALAVAVKGHGARVETKSGSLKSSPPWSAYVILDGEIVAKESAATPGGAERKLIESLLRPIESTHERAADLLQRAREAGVEVRNG